MGGGPARRGGEGKRGGVEARSSLVSFDIMSDITDCCIAMDFFMSFSEGGQLVVHGAGACLDGFRHVARGQ